MIWIKKRTYPQVTIDGCLINNEEGKIVPKSRKVTTKVINIRMFQNLHFYEISIDSSGVSGEVA